MLIHRQVGGSRGNWLKIEGADSFGGASTIAGFPLSNNNTAGTTSKHSFYRVNPSTSTNHDWIWISWEIVSVYYQNHLRVPLPDVNHHFRAGTNNAASWEGSAILNYNYRKFGDYGFQLNNF